jgi:plastocyanin
VKRDTFAVPKPNVPGSITRMEVDLEDANGPVPIDRLMLHHIVFLNTGANDTACGGPERFYGAGEERLKLALPPGFGYPMGSGSWLTTWMFMNHRAQTDTSFIRYRVTIEPDPVREVRGLWMDVGDCKYDPIYNIPGIERPFIPDCAKASKAAKKKGTKRARKKAKRCRRNANRAEASIPPEATHVETQDVQMPAGGGILVAGAGHVHGGAKALSVTKPSCGNTEVVRSVPTWGNPDHSFYNVKPVLHEPGPIGMSGFNTPTGIPFGSGQTLRLNSLYDDLQPHTRVMGIYMMFWAPLQAGDPTDVCAGAPGDIDFSPGTTEAGRGTPVPFTVPLTGIDSSGNAIAIDGPPGEFKTLQNGATVTVGDRFFSEPNVKVTPGTTLKYRFTGSELHNLTLANGPLGIGSPDMNGGGTYSQTFTRPGTYRFFCGLHPVKMTERVVVEYPKKKKKPKKAKQDRKRRR